MSANSLHEMLKTDSAAGNFFRIDQISRGVKFGMIYVLNQTKLDFNGGIFYPTSYLNWTYESTSNPQDFEIVLNGLSLPNGPVLIDLDQVPSRCQYFIRENAEWLKKITPDALRTQGLSTRISQILKQSQPKCIDELEKRIPIPYIDLNSPNFNPYKQGGNNPDPHMRC